MSFRRCRSQYTLLVIRRNGLSTDKEFFRRIWGDFRCTLLAETEKMQVSKKSPRLRHNSCCCRDADILPVVWHSLSCIYGKVHITPLIKEAITQGRLKGIYEFILKSLVVNFTVRFLLLSRSTATSSSDMRALVHRWSAVANVTADISYGNGPSFEWPSARLLLTCDCNLSPRFGIGGKLKLCCSHDFAEIHTKI